MRNIYPDLMIKMSILLPDFGCMHGRRTYMHVTFLVGEIADRILGRALDG